MTPVGYNSIFHWYHFAQGGMNFDNILVNEFGAVTGCMNYAAVSNPLDKESDPVKVQLTRLTGGSSCFDVESHIIWTVLCNLKAKRIYEDNWKLYE